MKYRKMDINDLLYNHTTSVNPKRGSLLMAEPLMKDDYFGRAVVLVLDIDEHEGHLGLVMNKPTEFDLNDLIPELGLKRRIPVYCGGPVDHARVFMLHTLGDYFEGSVEILPGLYVGGSIDQIYEYLAEGGELEGKIRFFLGYSGWTAGQLQNEILKNVWAATKEEGQQTARLLENKGEAYWRREVERMGEDMRGWLLVPSNPSYN